MKLSKETNDILENFSTINPGIVFRVGSNLWVKNPEGTIFGFAEIKEHFSKEFAIADLNRFLSVYSLFDSPELNFGERSLVFSEGKRKSEYFYSSPSIISTVKTNNKVKIDDPILKFTLSSDDLKKIISSSGTLGVNQISFIGDGKTASVVIHDERNETLGSFVIDIDSSIISNIPFNIKMDLGKMKFIKSSYEVLISFTDTMKLVNFKSTEKNVEYWLSVTDKSTIG